MPVISCIAKPNKYEFYDDIIEIGEYYLKYTNNIDEISIKILDNIYKTFPDKSNNQWSKALTIATYMHFFASYLQFR